MKKMMVFWGAMIIGVWEIMLQDHRCESLPQDLKEVGVHVVLLVESDDVCLESLKTGLQSGCVQLMK